MSKMCLGSPHRAELDELDVAINKLRIGEKLDAKYKDHQLQGKLKKYREFHLKGDLLVLYTITPNPHYALCH